MGLTNAQRQARHRERLKRIVAEAATLSPIMADLLLRTRVNIREWKRAAARFESGDMHFYTNREDRSADHVANLRRMIAENGALLAKYDPEGLMSDGNAELGDIPPVMGVEMWPGRPVSFVLNREGLAEELRLFTSASMARTDASTTPGRLSGKIGEDGWSVAAAEDSE
jgi:hypothetical protein